MKLIWQIIIALILIFIIWFVIAANTDDVGNDHDIELDAVDDGWLSIRANDVANVPEGWSTPKRLAINDDLWEDSSYLSRDGNTLYYAIYPGKDLMTDIYLGEFNPAGNIRNYVSEWPFVKKKVYDKYYLYEDTWSANGIFIAPNKDHYYNSNRDYINDQNSDDDIYINDRRLDWNTDESYGNPHYCALKDELYFDKAHKGIFMYKNGEIKTVFYEEGKEFAQPFLTEDCETMYFSTDAYGPFGIYRVDRKGDVWGMPEMMIYSKLAVGEFTMSSDGKRAVFVQVFNNPETNAYSSDLFYIEKV